MRQDRKKQPTEVWNMEFISKHSRQFFVFCLFINAYFLLTVYAQKEHKKVIRKLINALLILVSKTVEYNVNGACSSN